MTELKDEDKEIIAEALLSGNKIEAIKLLREKTGLGLKEAKEFIDALSTELNKKYPERMSQNKSGCGTALIMFSALSGLYYLL